MTPRLAAAVDASLISRRWRALALGFQAAYRSSAIGTVVSRAAGCWTANSGFERRRLIGISLVTAAGAHAALRALQGSNAGWLWLIVPGIAAVQGLLLVAASRPAPVLDE